MSRTISYLDMGQRRRGFTLIELLAVVIILAVLSSVAAPLYVQSRNASAARACRYNLKVIASAQSAYALRYGAYCYDVTSKSKGKGKGVKPATYAASAAYVAPTTPDGAPTGGLVGAPEGMSHAVVCPLDGSVYTCVKSGDDGTDLDMQCPNRHAHADAMGANSPSDWQCTLLNSRETQP